MDTSRLDHQTIALLSQITHQPLNRADLTPPILFLASLIILLEGVMVADRQETEAERQRLLTTPERFIPSESEVIEIARLMIQGVMEANLYEKPEALVALTATFSESEKLLLISLGYEMSAVDGHMEVRERQYLQTVAQELGLEPRYLAVFEAGFSRQGKVEGADLARVRSLLDPARFRELDTVFVKAASEMLAILPMNAYAPNYEALQAFQQQRQQLGLWVEQLQQIMQESHDRTLLPTTLLEEIAKIQHHLQQHRFRLVLLGDFSTGKSTLLNALVGEEIQPVRAIPCNGVVTVLRHGSKKRVRCFYRNGQEEELALEQYKEKVTLPEKLALADYPAAELLKSEIQEIVYEHPDVELCKLGVEVVDSPGWDDYFACTEIQPQLLQGNPLVIFTTHSQRLLTQEERNWLHQLRTRLNGGKVEAIADPLFLVVNFMDLLQSDQEVQGVKQQLEHLVDGQTPLLMPEDHIYYLSAQAAVEVFLRNRGASSQDQAALEAFRGFTRSIDQFLAHELGATELTRTMNQLQWLIQVVLEGFAQAEALADGRVSEFEQVKILSRIGEASWYNVRLGNLKGKGKKQATQGMTEAWQTWHRGLRVALGESSQQWKPNLASRFSQKKLAQDYAQAFNRDLAGAIAQWTTTQLQPELERQLAHLDAEIHTALETIQTHLGALTQEMNLGSALWGLWTSEARGQYLPDQSQAGILPQEVGQWTSIALEAGLVSEDVADRIAATTTGLGLVFSVNAMLAAITGTDTDLKQKIIDLGYHQLMQSAPEILQKICQEVNTLFDHRVNLAAEQIKKVIFYYDNLLEQRGKVRTSKGWIAQKRIELEELRKTLEQYAVH